VRRGVPPINLLGGLDSGHSSRLYFVSANYVHSQLVKNVAHAKRNREATRLVNKEVSDLRKVQTHDGGSISGPFTPEEVANTLNHLELGISRD